MCKMLNVWRFVWVFLWVWPLPAPNVKNRPTYHWNALHTKSPLFVLINMISSPLHIWLCQFKCGILPAHCQPHIGLEILKLEGKPVFGSWVTCCLPVDAPPAAAARIISTVYSETRRPACNSASQQLGVWATSLADLALWAECQAWWSRPPPARLSSTTRWGRRWNPGKVKKKKGKSRECKCFI